MSSVSSLAPPSSLVDHVLVISADVAGVTPVKNHAVLIISALICFLLTLISGILPVQVIEYYTNKFSNRNKKDSQQQLSSSIEAQLDSVTGQERSSLITKDRVLQFLTQLGGGVLLYTSLIHMLPEIRENYAQYLNATRKNDSDSTDPLPLVDLCACAGFFAIFLIEEVMHGLFLGEHHSHKHHLKSEMADDVKNLSLKSIGAGSLYQRQVDDNAKGEAAQAVKKSRSTCARLLDAFLLILAFSCHAVFDGVSIGVQTTASRVWTVLIAILSHKLLITFILSVQIYERCCHDEPTPQHEYDKTVSVPPTARQPIKSSKLILWFFSIMFAAMSPIGILLVLALDSATNGSDVPGEQQLHIIVLAAISAGTIIYIVFLEIMDKSISRSHISGFVQWAALLIGFGLMHFVAHCFPE